jgi:diketogulonate reductase-like aldo/keto reductase
MKILEANGAKIPALGLGTWTLKGDECVDLVGKALEAGYRHIDTAAMYGNESDVYKGISSSKVSREEIFLTSKVWPTDIADGDLQKSVEASLERLNTPYLDLALIHWPSKIVPMAESIKALNDIKSRGLARHIGVSNFTNAMIDEAVTVSEHPLVCNQVENHPLLDQSKMRLTCARHGLALIAYCPLSRGGDLFNEQVIMAAANAHDKTPAQIVLRWHVQHDGAGAIPKTATPARLLENLNIFDFELSLDELASISALTSTNNRICDYDFSPDWD